ncbi:MAG: oligosaccharide flippase family protein, partial [Anaerolineales bacterium]|nr:oligosaccharide flippase family protein [Anaerolineales bacterium]
MIAEFSARRVAGNIGALLSASVVARGLSAVTLILTARKLGPELFGPYAASLSVTRIAAVIFALGLDTWLLRSGGLDKARLQSRVTAALIIEVVVGVFWLLGVAAVVPWFNHDSFPTQIVVLCAASVLFEELVNSVASAFKAALKNGVTLLVLAGSQALLLAVTLLIIWRGGETAVLFLWGRVGATAVSALVGFVILHFLVGYRLQLSEIKRALRETRSFGASVALGNLSRQADVTIVATW